VRAPHRYTEVHRRYEGSCSLTMMLKAAEAALHVNARHSPRHRSDPGGGCQVHNRQASWSVWSALSSRWSPEGGRRGSARSRLPPKQGVGDLVEAARQRVVRSGQARLTASCMRSVRFGTFRVARCRTAWSAPRPRTPRLQGVSPLMSPLRHTAVSSDTSLAPPMGFVPLRGSLDSRRRLR
jgi:hypothetical protein